MSPSTAAVRSPHPTTSSSTPLHLPTGPFRPRVGVLTARALDAMALYDPWRERYLTLDPVATRIWELLSDGQSPAGIVEHLCVEYTVPREQAIADVAAQIAGFLCDRLIEPGTIDYGVRTVALGACDAGCQLDAAESVPAVLRVPSVLRCGMTIARIKWLLGTSGFEGTLAWIRARIENIPATATAELDRVRALEYAVAMAGALYPGRARCLEQSLTLFYLLRRQGVAVKYCQGAQPYPFQAHAWIEYRGEVINDVPEHSQFFARFPDQLP
jgi:hypothetical protein